MKHHATRDFWLCHQGLPPVVRDLADRNFVQLKADLPHPSLQFKRVGTLWSARVGLHHRALATRIGDDVIWFWIGSHAEYDRLIA